MSRSTIPSKRSADTQEAAWIADEDRFVLQQAKKKAAIRVKSGRAQPLDWLAVTLAVIDPERNTLDDELEDADVEITDPQSIYEDLDIMQLAELEKGIDTYLALESSRSNLDYWNVRLVHAPNSSSTDTDRLLDDENDSSRPATTITGRACICASRQLSVH